MSLANEEGSLTCVPKQSGASICRKPALKEKDERNVENPKFVLGSPCCKKFSCVPELVARRTV